MGCAVLLFGNNMRAFIVYFKPKNYYVQRWNDFVKSANDILFDYPVTKMKQNYLMNTWRLSDSVGKELVLNYWTYEFYS